MTPNLFLAVQAISSPTKWFSRKRARTINGDCIEHCENPVPGYYKFRPAEGWYLVQADDPASLPESLRNSQQPLRYSPVLKRWILETEHLERERTGFLPKSCDSLCTISREGAGPKQAPGVANNKFPEGRHSNPTSKEARPSVSRRNSDERPLVGFFRLDDGITWVNNIDGRGNFIEGPYRRYVFEQETGRFRPMVKRDDPLWRAARQSTSATRVSQGASASSSASLASSRRPLSLQNMDVGREALAAGTGDVSSGVGSMKSRPTSTRIPSNGNYSPAITPKEARKWSR